jgi:hypothetical protein
MLFVQKNSTRATDVAIASEKEFFQAEKQMQIIHR